MAQADGSHGGGVMVDPSRMSAARKSAMLERAELSDLSKILELREIAADAGVDIRDEKDLAELRKLLTASGVQLIGKRLGISRDELAKLETGGRKRPRITTLRKFLDTVNYARARRGKPPLDVEDVQVPGEVLIPGPEKISSILDREAAEAEALAEYQEASNDIYYATQELLEDAETGK